MNTYLKERIKSNISKQLEDELYYLHGRKFKNVDPYFDYVEGVELLDFRLTYDADIFTARIEQDRLVAFFTLESVQYKVLYDTDTAKDFGDPIPEDILNRIYKVGIVEIELERNIDWVDLPINQLPRFDELSSIHYLTDPKILN